MSETIPMLPVSVFVSLAPADAALHALLAAEASAAGRAVEWVSNVPEGPVNGAWRMTCRVSILGCQGMIAVVSADPLDLEQLAWPIRCARAAGIPLLLILAEGAAQPRELPAVIENSEIIAWSAGEIRRFLAGL